MAPGVNASDILNRLTTVSWWTVVELTKALSAYYQHRISTRAVLAAVADLERRGLVIRRPRQEAGGMYGAAEYQLTAEGARVRVRLGATDYDPFASFQGLTAGAFRLRASATGYNSSTASVTLSQNSTLDIRLTRPANPTGDGSNDILLFGGRNDDIILGCYQPQRWQRGAGEDVRTRVR